tara:strand:+ start:461 stop:646 length:186 start_codon:yes stop_codon:yes gene_type:complete
VLFGRKSRGAAADDVSERKEKETKKTKTISISARSKRKKKFVHFLRTKSVVKNHKTTEERG